MYVLHCMDAKRLEKYATLEKSVYPSIQPPCQRNPAALLFLRADIGSSNNPFTSSKASAAAAKPADLLDLLSDWPASPGAAAGTSAAAAGAPSSSTNPFNSSFTTPQRQSSGVVPGAAPPVDAFGQMDPFASLAASGSRGGYANGVQPVPWLQRFDGLVSRATGGGVPTGALQEMRALVAQMQQHYEGQIAQLSRGAR